MSDNGYRIFETRTDATAGMVWVTDGIVNPTGTKYSHKMVPRAGLVGFTLQTTGTLNGTFSLWYSDKEAPNTASDDDWVQDTGWTHTDPAGSATKVKYVVSDLETRWVRVKYVHASGSGSLFGYRGGGR